MQTSVMDEEGLYRPPVLGMLLGAGLSVSCVMLGERSQVSFLLVLLRDLPHTYSCTYFLFNKRTKGGNNQGLCRLQTSESLKFY